MAIKCRKCGIAGHEAHGVVLQRVNELGVEGVWECRPVCGAQMDYDDVLVAAIEGAFECQHSQVVYEPHRQCAECGIPMPSPSVIAKSTGPSYSAKELREDLLYEYLGQSPEPGLFEFLDWLVERDEKKIAPV